MTALWASFFKPSTSLMRLCVQPLLRSSRCCLHRIIGYWCEFLVVGQLNRSAPKGALWTGGLSYREYASGRQEVVRVEAKGVIQGKPRFQVQSPIGSYARS